METDPAYQREETAVQSDQLDLQVRAILKRYDGDGDGRLDRAELERLRTAVRAFTEAMGSPDNVWLVGYPYWADSRLVGINSGFPARDYGIFPDGLPQTLNYTGAKLFLIYPTDDSTARAQRLRSSRLYRSSTIHHDRQPVCNASRSPVLS